MAVAELDFLDTRGLNEDQRSEIEGMRRSERLERIAELENRKLSDLIADLSQHTGSVSYTHLTLPKIYSV